MLIFAGILPLLGDDMTQLVVFRAIQGFGRELFAIAFSIIADLFAPAERERSRAALAMTYDWSCHLFSSDLQTQHATGLAHPTWAKARAR